MMFLDLLSKKVNVFFREKGELKFRKIKGKLKYDRKEKKWYLKFGNENLPAPENIYDYMFCDNIIVVRTGANTYQFLNPYTNDPSEPDKYTIPPEDIYTATIKATMRLERMKGMLERFLPIIFVVIAAIGIAIFFVIIWSNVAQSLEKISENFAQAMKSLENVIAKSEMVPR